MTIGEGIFYSVIAILVAPVIYGGLGIELNFSRTRKP